MADKVNTAKRYVRMTRDKLSSARRKLCSGHRQETIRDLYYCFSHLCAAGVLLDEAESEKGDG